MFKCFKFIDDMMKQLNEADELQMISEADEMPTEDEAVGGDEAEGGDAGAGAEEAAPQGDMGAESGEEMGGEELPDDGGEMSPQEDPSQIAEVDNGTFISDLGNAEVAKTLLKAVAKAYPNEIIPQQFEVVTTQNADDVIQYAKNILQIDSADQNNPYENMSYQDAMKNV